MELTYYWDISFMRPSHLIIFSIQIQVMQPSTIKVWVLLLILLHPHTYKEEGINSSFLDNSEISINMKQTNINRNIWNTSPLQQGHLPWHKLPTQHEISVATCNISSNKILVCIAIQLLPVFTCYLQSVCRASFFFFLTG